MRKYYVSYIYQNKYSSNVFAAKVSAEYSDINEDNMDEFIEKCKDSFIEKHGEGEVVVLGWSGL